MVRIVQDEGHAWSARFCRRVRQLVARGRAGRLVRSRRKAGLRLAMGGIACDVKGCATNPRAGHRVLEQSVECSPQRCVGQGRRRQARERSCVEIYRFFASMRHRRRWLRCPGQFSVTEDSSVGVVWIEDIAVEHNPTVQAEWKLPDHESERDFGDHKGLGLRDELREHSTFSYGECFL